jgi:hypothetical protein
LDPLQGASERGVYVHVQAGITIKRTHGGIRAKLYEIAGEHHAMCIRHEQPFYRLKNVPEMRIDLYFSLSDNGGDFIGRLVELTRFGCVRNKVECSRTLTRVVMPHAAMEYVYRTDSNRDVNPYSPSAA